MRFVAYGFNLNTDNHDLIRQMIGLVGEDAVDIYDLQNYEATHTPEDVVFFFGEHWRVADAREKPCRVKIDFPDVDRLASDYGDEAERELAYEKLLKLKGALSSGDPSGASECAEERQVNVIKEESLPDLTSQQVLQQLEAAMEQQGVQAWEGVTKDGLKARLSLEPEDGTADVNLTFAELFFIRAAMETLKIREFELVPKSSFIRKSNP